eukprot:jgi/Bigna1/69327/fgenesh1_pg.8_\
MYQDGLGLASATTIYERFWQKYESKFLSKDGLAVTIPDCPKDESSELACAIALIFHNRGMCPPSEVKGRHETWKDAYSALFQELSRRLREEKDESAFRDLIAMKDHRERSPQDYKDVFSKAKGVGEKIEVFTLDWPSAILQIDPKLATKFGYEKGMDSCCWNCGVTGKLLSRCIRCKKARYCSLACQKQSWWHHKRTDNAEHRCISHKK